jgi:hypothetical protein
VAGRLFPVDRYARRCRVHRRLESLHQNDKRVTNDPMEAHVIGSNMWVKAVEKAGGTDPDAVIESIVGVSVPNLHDRLRFGRGILTPLVQWTTNRPAIIIRSSTGNSS